MSEHLPGAPDMDTLAILADWKQCLRSRIARRRLIFELVDADILLDDLVAEAECFKRCCHAFQWRP